MALDVDIPDSPTLHGPQNPDDYEAVDEPENWPGDNYRPEDLPVSDYETLEADDIAGIEAEFDALGRMAGDLTPPRSQSAPSLVAL